MYGSTGDQHHSPLTANAIAEHNNRLSNPRAGSNVNADGGAPPAASGGGSAPAALSSPLIQPVPSAAPAKSEPLGLGSTTAKCLYLATGCLFTVGGIALLSSGQQGALVWVIRGDNTNALFSDLWCRNGLCVPLDESKEVCDSFRSLLSSLSTLAVVCGVTMLVLTLIAFSQLLLRTAVTVIASTVNNSGWRALLSRCDQSCKAAVSTMRRKGKPACFFGVFMLAVLGANVLILIWTLRLMSEDFVPCDYAPFNRSLPSIDGYQPGRGLVENLLGAGCVVLCATLWCVFLVMSVCLRFAALQDEDSDDDDAAEEDGAAPAAAKQKSPSVVSSSQKELESNPSGLRAMP